MLRIGIVGAGDIAYTHAKVFSRLSNTVIIAVANPRIEKARKLVSQFGGKAFFSLEEILNTEKTDVIDICSPDYFHASQTVMALKEGKHVLSEKPIALSLEEADKVVQAAKKSSGIFMVAHVLRFFPEYEWIRELLEQGGLGDPLSATAVRLNAPPIWRRWFANRKLSGGASIDLLVHDADFYHWIFGRARKVLAFGKKDEHGLWNHSQALISFASGVTGSAEVSYSMPIGFPPTFFLRIVGEKGCVEYNSRSRQSLILFEPGKKALYPDIRKEDPFLREIRYFVNCIEQNRRLTITTPEEARYALRITLAAIESMEKNGQSVVIG